MINKKFVVRCRGIIIHKGKMLVVRHTPESHLALPGGHLEFGESIKECMSREIVEELGIKPKIGRLLYVNNFCEKTNKNEGIQSIEFFFEIINSADYLDTMNVTRTHASEISEILWLDTSEEIGIMPSKISEDFKKGEVLSDIVRYID